MVGEIYMFEMPKIVALSFVSESIADVTGGAGTDITEGSNNDDI